MVQFYNNFYPTYLSLKNDVTQHFNIFFGLGDLTVHFCEKYMMVGECDLWDFLVDNSDRQNE